MSIEFAVFDSEGRVVDTIDPYLSHQPLNEDGTLYRVDNGYNEYDITIPEGGRYEIRPMVSL